MSNCSTYNRIDEDRMMLRGDMYNGSFADDFQEFNPSTYGDGSGGNLSKLDFDYIAHWSRLPAKKHSEVWSNFICTFFFVSSNTEN